MKILIWQRLNLTNCIINQSIALRHNRSPHLRGDSAIVIFSLVYDPSLFMRARFAPSSPGAIMILDFVPVASSDHYRCSNIFENRHKARWNQGVLDETRVIVFHCINFYLIDDSAPQKKKKKKKWVGKIQNVCYTDLHCSYRVFMKVTGSKWQNFELVDIFAIIPYSKYMLSCNCM